MSRIVQNSRPVMAVERSLTMPLNAVWGANA
jgi:hypothetical protein